MGCFLYAVLTLVCPLLLTLLPAVRNNVDCAGTTGPMMHLTDWRQLSYQAEPHCCDCAGLLLEYKIPSLCSIFGYLPVDPVPFPWCLA